MDEKSIYSEEDCIHAEADTFFSGVVIVLKPEALPENQRGIRQLLFCINGADGVPDADTWPVRAICLADGECVQRRRSEILGLLKPELLPDRARLQLSQIRPLDTAAPKEPEFTGYCFLPDGRYAAGVPLADDLEVREYIDIQRAYQHRLMICDSEDSCVFEMQEGKLLYPTREMLEANLKQQEQEGTEQQMDGPGM